MTWTLLFSAASWLGGDEELSFETHAVTRVRVCPIAYNKSKCGEMVINVSWCAKPSPKYNANCSDIKYFYQLLYSLLKGPQAGTPCLFHIHHHTHNCPSRKYPQLCSCITETALLQEGLSRWTQDPDSSLTSGKTRKQEWQWCTWGLKCKQ